MRRYGLVRDDRALAPLWWMVVAILVVVIVVVTALVVMASGDQLDANKPTKDTVAYITADVTIGDFDNQWGEVEARDVSLSLRAYEYDGQSSRWGLSLASLFSWSKDEFDVTAQVRCVGPGGFDETAKDAEHIEVDEWVWGKTGVSFDTLRFFVERTGTYTLTLKIYVDAPDEGIEDEMVHSTSKTVVVS